MRHFDRRAAEQVRCERRVHPGADEARFERPADLPGSTDGERPLRKMFLRLPGGLDETSNRPSGDTSLVANSYSPSRKTFPLVARMRK